MVAETTPIWLEGDSATPIWPRVVRPPPMAKVKKEKKRKKKALALGVAEGPK
jgi:hypothetical protein